MVIASFGNLVIKKLEIDPIVLVFYRQVFLDCKLLLLIKDFCKGLHFVSDEYLDFELIPLK